MFSSITNRAYSPIADRSNHPAAYLTSNHAESAVQVQAPPILRQGPARGTSNSVAWDRFVLVKPIDLGINEEGEIVRCFTCESRQPMCNCNRSDHDHFQGFEVVYVPADPARVAEDAALAAPAKQPADLASAKELAPRVKQINLNNKLRQSPSFLSGKKKSLPWRINIGEEKLAKIRSLTASLRKSNQERYRRVGLPAAKHVSAGPTVVSEGPSVVSEEPPAETRFSTVIADPVANNAESIVQFEAGEPFEEPRDEAADQVINQPSVSRSGNRKVRILKVSQSVSGHYCV